VTNAPDERGLELRELFFETSQELLQALNDEALKLEKNPGDEEIVRSIRRTVHTLKGDSAACGLRELSELAHQFEDALSLEAAACHGELAEIAFSATDIFSEMLASYHGGTPMPDTESLRNKITELTSTPAAEKLRREKKSAEPSPLFSREWSEAEKNAIAQAQAGSLPVYGILAKIDPHCAMPIAARQLIHNAVAKIGQIIVVRPDAHSRAAAKQVEFVVASWQTEAQLLAHCHIPTITGDISVTVIEAAAPAETPASIPGNSESQNDETDRCANPTKATPEASAPEKTASPQPIAVEPQPQAVEPAASQAQVENILRVEAGRIDNVLNLVGELIIGKSMLQQALGEFGKRYPKDSLRGKFADAMAFQARVLNDLQRSVMKIRMVPVDHVFRRFPRIVRDVARQCGREVDLELAGQETDLDKGILDAIAEPLTHLVRNAVSHGIETPEQRTRQGKSPRGKIRLNAYHQGNQVMVEISDDGRGIDSQKIRAKAVDLGMATPEEAARLTESEALEFIFRPGFSTAEQITEVSGRGVGMDVVQSVLQRLKATIHVETHPGRGTTFRLKLPLTLAIIKALMFWVEQRLYAIPLNAVSQIARSRESEVHRVDNYEVLQLRNQVLPLLRLGRPPGAESEGKPAKLFVLVIVVGEKKYGLVVDALEGEEELVIKALDDQTFSTDLVNGASILGNGHVVLILNLPAVVEHAARNRPREIGMTNSGLLLNHAERAELAMAAGGGRA
jgi:two-component system, chemotaxis family, sensor kinase CheA